MKKFSVILLAVCLIFSFFVLTACGNQASESTSQTSSSNDTTNTTSTPTSTPTTSVASPKITSVDFYSSNIRKIFVLGEEFSSQGLAVNAHYENGSMQTIFANGYQIDLGGYDKTKTGKYTITVSVEEFKHSFDVVVIDNPVVENNVLNVKIDSTFTGNMGELNAQNQSQFAKIGDALTMLTGAKIGDGVIKNFYIQPGTYKEKLKIESNTKNVRFIGENAETTIITYDDCSGKVGGTDASSTITVKGEGFMAKNITFENSYDYINDKTYSDKQAVAALIDADKCIFDNCAFLGYQDTLQAKNGRQYYKNCVIKGTTDFIFGKAAVAVFDNCDIVTRFTEEGSTNNGYITAHSGKLTTPSADGSKGMLYGYVFMGCTLSAETGVLDGTVSLGRPWRCDATVAYINCEMGAHIATSAYGTEGETKTRYTSMSGGGRINIPSEASFFEYGNTGAGAVSVDNDDFTLLDNIDNYTLTNIFANSNGLLTFTTEWNAQADINAFCS